MTADVETRPRSLDEMKVRMAPMVTPAGIARGLGFEARPTDVITGLDHHRRLRPAPLHEAR